MESVCREIVRRLREAGHQALFAGGCVRDALMGKMPHDFDIATSARPEQVQALFPANRCSWAPNLASFWWSKRAATIRWRRFAPMAPTSTAATREA